MALASENLISYVQVTPGTPLVGNSSGAAQANNCTITAPAAQTAYVQGFTVTGVGATAASAITVTLADGTNTMKFTLLIPAGATTAITPLTYTFSQPFPAATTGATWTLSVPSFGAGNTNASATLYGFTV